MLVAGDFDNVESELAPYFSGSYLSYWQTEFAEFERKNWTTTGAVDFTVVDAGDYQREVDSGESVAIFACVDFREAVVRTSEGDVVERGYEFSIDRIDMTRAPDAPWKATELDSVPVDEPISETPCADTFA